MSEAKKQVILSHEVNILNIEIQKKMFERALITADKDKIEVFTKAIKKCDEEIENQKERLNILQNEL